MFTEFIGSLPWGTITPSTLAVSFAVASAYVIMSGKLIPHSWVERRDADHEAHIRYLEAETSEQRATIASLVQQNAELSAAGRLSVALLQALQNGKPPNIEKIEIEDANVPAIDE